jgi:flavin reductase (DIM6/NTAB) family NADH-FMN oxidoreductase RutF
MPDKDNWYSYEPVKGHGLPHDPLSSIVGPRPIGWISTVGKNGTSNLAPYSFFNLFNYTPPIVGFASIGEKDTLRNVRETGVFVWNLATRELAECLNETSAPLRYGDSEFNAAGLTPLAAEYVAAPRVAESLVHCECRVTDIQQLRNSGGDSLQTWLVLGEVVAVHISRRLLVDGQFDTFGAGVILRAGGHDFALITPESRFELRRP